MKRTLSALLFVVAAFVMTGCASVSDKASTLADANVQMTQTVAAVTEAAAATGLLPADKAAAAVVATKVAAGVATAIQSDVQAVTAQVKQAKAAAAQVKAAASAPTSAASAPAVEIATDPVPVASQPIAVPVASAPASVPPSDSNTAILAGISAVALAGAGLFTAWKKKYPASGGQ